MWLTSLTWLLSLGAAYVAVWRGVWGLLDLVLLPSQPLLSAVVSVGLALLIGHPLTYLRLTVAEETASRPWLATMHDAAAAIASVLLWRGGWVLLDAALGTDVDTYAASAAAASAVLALLRCLPSPADMPPVPQLRRARIPVPQRLSHTLLDVDTDRRPVAAVLDALLSLVGVEGLLLLVWRGAWSLLNLAMLPLGWMAAPLALAIGSAGVLLCTRVPGALSWLGDREHVSSWRSRLREDLVCVLTVLAVVNYWKGVWGFLDMMAVTGCRHVVYILQCVLGFKILAVHEFGTSFAVGSVTFNYGTFEWLRPVYDDLDKPTAPVNHQPVI